MIQRIQTVYLILVAGMMLATLILPLGVVSEGGQMQLFDVYGLKTADVSPQIVSSWTLYFLPICTSMLAFITLFFYKRRKLQLNLCYLTIFSIILFYVFLFMYTYVPGETYASHIQFKIATTFPLFAIIFEFLAVFAIRKDEKLVRSLDRIR